MLKAFSITDIGKQRKSNQDYVFTSEQPVGPLPNLFIVADGMGGHNAGDFASQYTVEVIVEEIGKSRESSPVVVLEEAILSANRRVREKASEREAFSGMGTTVVVATIKEDELCVANVGDSRLYVVNHDIRQITRDHSLVEEMVLCGGISKEQARSHEKKNIITRAVGAEEGLDIDFFHVKLEKGDLVLMCSDGLTNMIEDKEICALLQNTDNIAEKAELLIHTANAYGGKDNIAVVLVEPFSKE